MAITDGLVSRIYAESGDATLTDKIQSVAMSGSGTASIVDVGGEAAWNLSGAAYTLTVPNKVMDFATDGVQNQGITIAMRYRINTFGSTGGYNRIIGGLLSDGTTKFAQLSKEGANVAGYWTTVRPISNLGAQTTATIHTLVLMVKSNTAGGWQDHLKAWRNTVSRVGTDADYSGAVTGGVTTFGGLYVNAPDTMNYDLLDLAYWDRELTDAEAAAVADDLRTELPIGGGGSSDTTPDAFSFTDQTDVAVSTLTTSNTVTITGIDTATAISVTGGEMSINSGAFTSSSTTVSVNDTVQLRVTSSASNSTAVAVTLDVGGVTDEWTVTTIAAAATGTITTGPFKNNTNTVQTGLTGLRVVVLDLTDGSTVLNSTGHSTHATTAVMTFSDAALTPGTTYGIVTIASDGSAVGIERIQAT